MLESITCPICGRVSHNIRDIQHQYCANCHVFWGEIVAHVYGSVTDDNIQAWKAVIKAAHDKLNKLPRNNLHNK
jgi:protein-arginine kinase activator protein McsA